jgi:hypothetical protein
MGNSFRWLSSGGMRVFVAVSFFALLHLTACKSAPQADTTEQDKINQWFVDVPELRTLKVSNAEITELARAHQVGISDQACVELIKLARSRQQPFAEGQSVADLLSAGVSEKTVLELARMNQFGIWAGQARALRLAGLGDNVILAVARRRSQGLPVLSGETLGKLKNTGLSDAAIQGMVEKGVTEQDAASFIAQRERAVGGHSFVYQGRGRRKR